MDEEEDDENEIWVEERSATKEQQGADANADKADQEQESSSSKWAKYE